MLGRTTLAAAYSLSAFVLLALAGMWGYAYANDQIRFIHRYYNTEPGMRGNHGPWRHHGLLRAVYDQAFFCALIGLMVSVFAISANPSRPAHTAAAGVLALVSLVAVFFHFPLFD